MSDLNQNARKLIEYYCSMEVPPEYALLIKGAWGCGKSHLVKDVIDSMKIANNELKFLSVSLYGISDISDIEAKFFEQLHPVLASKKMMFAGQIAKGVLKGALKIDLDGDGKADATANVSVPDINLAKYLTDTKKCILVFDDLERCSMDIQIILGYINYFVEKDGYKVLLIADETKLVALSDAIENSNKKYQSIKEKLIGKTVEVEADVDRIFDHFVEELVSQHHQKSLYKYKKTVVNSFNESNYKNLRSLRKCFLDLGYWFGLLDREVINNVDLMEHFLAVFISVSMEVHAGRLLPKQVAQLYGIGINYLAMPDEELSNRKDEFKDIKDKYSITFLDSIIDIGYLKRFFEAGYINALEINSAFKESRYFSKENTPDWKKLWYFYELEDKEFIVLQESVLKSFEDRDFTNLCELKHVLGLFLMHSKNKLLDKTPQELLNDTNDYLNDIDNEKTFEISDELLEELNGYGSYQGLGYTCREDADFQLISNAINEFILRIKVVSMKEDAVSFVEAMNTDPQRLISLFRWSNEQKHYADTPILQFAPIDAFFTAFLNLPNGAKRSLLSIFVERLNYNCDVEHKLYPEFVWMKSFHSKLSEHLAKASPSVSKVVIEHNVKLLSERISVLEESIAQKNAVNPKPI
ncbi:NTPase [Agarivorans sp. Toyoura001]|uniref:P-loop NTPase fold protein n=1 Tax=Agarivorans sp. Toyoura001 TaxID=2283141 RepID=UPI0010DC9419|nr:P-loop NTPase fold protein [Agarivorans sp. Toyoura001]GDY26424.1 NTPase [Agarivorans sp. Toyoura001]